MKIPCSPFPMDSFLIRHGPNTENHTFSQEDNNNLFITLAIEDSEELRTTHSRCQVRQIQPFRSEPFRTANYEKLRKKS